MAIKTTASSRFRTELKTLSNASLGGLETAYSDLETTICDGDNTKTWTVRIVASYYDGVNYIVICEASYPEVNEDPTAQVPILT